ncbi:hypothetical protein D3C86_982900 [compost metagenome]
MFSGAYELRVTDNTHDSFPGRPLAVSRYLTARSATTAFQVGLGLTRPRLGFCLLRIGSPEELELLNRIDYLRLLRAPGSG